MKQTDKEYAGALFELTVEEGITEQCLSDLRMIRDVFSKDPEYIDFLTSPAVSQNEKLSAIDEAFSKSIHMYVLFYLKLLCEKGRIKLIFNTISEYEKLYLEYKGIKTALITSAVELSDTQKTTLIEKLEKTLNKKINASFSEDPSLIGGVIIELDGMIYDGSLSGRLRDVKEVMMDEPALGDK